MVQLTPVNSLRSPCLVDRDGNPLLRPEVLSEEDLLDEEDEADVSILPQEVQHLCLILYFFSPSGFKIQALVMTKYALLFEALCECLCVSCH